MGKWQELWTYFGESPEDSPYPPGTGPLDRKDRTEPDPDRHGLFRLTTDTPLMKAVRAGAIDPKRPFKGTAHPEALRELLNRAFLDSSTDVAEVTKGYRSRASYAGYLSDPGKMPMDAALVLMGTVDAIRADCYGGRWDEEPSEPLWLCDLYRAQADTLQRLMTPTPPSIEETARQELRGLVEKLDARAIEALLPIARELVSR